MLATNPLKDNKQYLHLYRQALNVVALRWSAIVTFYMATVAILIAMVEIEIANVAIYNATIADHLRVTTLEDCRTIEGSVEPNEIEYSYLLVDILAKFL